MKTCFRSARIVLTSLCLATGIVTGSAQEQSDDAQSAVPTREDTVLMTITAEVEAINQTTREVTLKGPRGKTVQFIAGPQVKRLNEVQVGDLVSADYLVSMVYELRAPTEAETANPLVILEDAARASKEEAPGAIGVRRIKAVCTIEGLDRPSMTATLQGPLGNYLIVGIADPANLPLLRIGQSVVVTYTEALAVSLQKLEAADE